MAKFVFKIDGADMPAPVKFDYKIAALDVDSGRDTVTGKMHRNVLSLGKYTISVEYAITDAAKTAKVLKALNKKFFEVTFTDPESATGAAKTITAYSGDRSMSVAAVNGIIYQTLKFDIIEK